MWPSCRQDIFQRRISSISSNVPNYMINLLDQVVIRSFIEDDGVVLSKGLRSIPANPGCGNDLIAFKQACLICLETPYPTIADA